MDDDGASSALEECSGVLNAWRIQKKKLIIFSFATGTFTEQTKLKLNWVHVSAVAATYRHRRSYSAGTVDEQNVRYKSATP